MILGPVAAATVTLLVALLATDEIRAAAGHEVRRPALLAVEALLLLLALALCLLRLSQLL
jgi:hypothetical protein